MAKKKTYKIEVLGIEVSGKFRKSQYNYVMNMPQGLAEECYEKALTMLNPYYVLDVGYRIEVSSSVSALGAQRVLTLYKFVREKNDESIQYILSIRINLKGAELCVSGSAYGLLESLENSDGSNETEKGLLFSI
ncbi:MAG: hypothetical protein LBU34_10545 [Planctomycetaceae bacterium]|jgi:hypothetical protein|nr:hypothetical protein [Planctomycetaceae bacterium]